MGLLLNALLDNLRAVAYVSSLLQEERQWWWLVGWSVGCMKKYIPKAPSVSFAEAIKHVPTASLRRPKRLRAKPVERTGKPSVYSLPGFHDNVYARMLAAKPKMDTVTRQIYPSTILTKVGLITEDQVGPRSPHKIFRGPRLWVSSTAKSLPKQVVGRLLSKHPYLKKIKVQQAFHEKAQQVLLDDIKELTTAYKTNPPPPDRRVVCYLHAKVKASSIPVIDLTHIPELRELNLPSEIRSSQTGLHLAGFLVKYTYLYQKQT